MDRVAASAQLQVVLRLKVEAAIEIERGTIVVKLSPDAHAVIEHEIDFFRSRQKRAPDCRRRNAFRPFVLDPFDLGHDRPRLNRDAQDDLILDDEAAYRLFDGARLRGENAEQ